MMATELVIDFEDTTTAAEIREAITNVAFRATREFPKIERLTTDKPTPWTLRHREINRLLDELETAPR